MERHQQCTTYSTRMGSTIVFLLGTTGDVGSRYVSGLNVFIIRSIKDCSTNNCVTSRRTSEKGLLPITLEDTFGHWTPAGALCVTESGFIPGNLAPILERLGVNAYVPSGNQEGVGSLFSSHKKKQLTCNVTKQHNTILRQRKDSRPLYFI